LFSNPALAAAVGPLASDDNQLFEEMKKPAQEFKKSLAESFIHQSLGMSYAKFLEQADKLPDDFVMAKLSEIDEMKLRASLILAGFVHIEGEKEANPYLFVVQDSETHQDAVRIEADYAVIGSGTYVAKPSLDQRGQDSAKGLMETIYAVYEAKKMSEIVLGVGAATSIDIMEQGRMLSLSQAGHDACAKLFGKIGPRLKLSDKKKLNCSRWKMNI